MYSAVDARISRVRAGASERGRGGQIVAAESAIRHPDYSFKQFDSNVGIIRLQSYLVFGDSVRQATISAGGVVFPANVPVTIASWGRTAVSSFLKIFLSCNRELKDFHRTKSLCRNSLFRSV